jgi:hypothetical protein
LNPCERTPSYSDKSCTCYNPQRLEPASRATSRLVLTPPRRITIRIPQILKWEDSMKRILACSLLILGAPIIAATLQHERSGHTPFGFTALAGHTTSGGYCTCGCPGCICEPDEQLEMCLPDTRDGGKAVARTTGTPAQHSQSDVPAAALFVGTGLLILKRIRR